MATLRSLAASRQRITDANIATACRHVSRHPC